jgi:voltage-gated potassium channel
MEITAATATIWLIYFMLTTMSTVGYGSFYPFSIAEKFLGVFVEIIAVTLFSVLMSKFTEMTMSFIDDSGKGREDFL